ncbi:acyltransferase domain-containing protein [Catenulispora sp. NL8]|uniref:Acyltransferase domain-containing protein n=1 Tax=Catenulispora pinistramenti TaxID=2705254 RepID=A0ABS5KP42_9ACTN|nr:type I polyketide synthase [Catenulispora pinistramenti]MBS2547838.1 acyltransferase domain-containing protein [Catenulispora pinistramenti]
MTTIAEPESVSHQDEAADTGGFVAVIGMAGRTPGAPDVEGFWKLVTSGADSITRAPHEGPGSARGLLQGADAFDAAFFGYSPLEAVMLDPQHRVFLECSWEALENAGYDPARHPGPIGVFGGSGDSDHLLALEGNAVRLPGVTRWQMRLSTGAAFLTSRVSYKLGLTGPAVTVQTACSTSLVAVHTAVQALIAGECDLALAGGVTIQPAPEGEDSVLSPSGRCRPFDAAADGTVSSEGAGIVVLKRYDDAVADGDRVRAVIRGSAVNNDGSGKAGFTTPSVRGQSAAVQAALSVAGVDPASIGYVEAHGTGTAVGDPIEVAALAKVFGSAAGPASCVLGSVKGNIGHTDAASGVLGLIKAILAVETGLIPGTAHYTTPNPELDLDRTPFVVDGRAQPWRRGAQPRRASVNSLGIGGTNAHVVLEQAPPAAPHDPGRPYQLLPLSARTRAALGEAATGLATALDGSAEPLQDVAWTLQTGRAEFPLRGFVVARDRQEAISALTDAAPEAFPVVRHGGSTSPVIFLYPGQGGQYVGMGRDLYEHEPVFRRALGECVRAAFEETGIDLRESLYPAAPVGSAEHAAASERLNGTHMAQIAVFAVQYALTELWRSWGVSPKAVLGHSLGAYAAATAAGVFDPAEAIHLVSARGALFERTPAGAMAAVQLSEDELATVLPPELDIAAVNGPRQCVVSGPREAVRRFTDQLTLQGHDVRLLRITTAAHSRLVEPGLWSFEKAVAQVGPRAPRLPWISDRTGLPMTAELACSPQYWTRHLRRTVRFDAALETLLSAQDGAVLLEIGPGHTLGSLVRRNPMCGRDQVLVQSLPHAAVGLGGSTAMLTGLGRLWQHGVSVDWTAVHSGEQRLRIPLPTYPFQRQVFRLPKGAESAGSGMVSPPSAAGTTAAGMEEAASLVVAHREDDGTYEAPVGETEEALAGLFARLTGIDRAGRHDHFFELGGDSLTANRLCVAARELIGAQISVREVLAAPTVARLARVVREAGT